MPVQYRVAKAKIAPGTYRKLTGNEALAMGLVAASQLANTPMVYAGYPITPASDILASTCRPEELRRQDAASGR